MPDSTAGASPERSPGAPGGQSPRVLLAPGPDRWRRVIGAVGYVLVFVMSVGYTNYVDHRTRSVFCAFLTASLPGATPPTTDRGREIERRYLKLIRDLRC